MGGGIRHYFHFAPLITGHWAYPKMTNTDPRGFFSWVTKMISVCVFPPVITRHHRMFPYKVPRPTSKGPIDTPGAQIRIMKVPRT